MEEERAEIESRRKNKLSRSREQQENKVDNSETKEKDCDDDDDSLTVGLYKVVVLYILNFASYCTFQDSGSVQINLQTCETYLKSRMLMPVCFSCTA